uniref:RRM domain-containing protein n=1 Tax=Macrostomum lignano TaxID=282301 RepID=A0A1I8IG10_9PLAT
MTLFYPLDSLSLGSWMDWNHDSLKDNGGLQYLLQNMIQPSASSRNTSPGNGENDRKSNTNLYIRGLQPSDTDETIRQLVSENASIPGDAINSTKAVLDEQTGQCKGYGFVDFRDETQAQLALEALTKTSLRNGKLQISYARESEKDPTNIYIKNLPTRPECNEEWMSRVFTDELGNGLTGRIISCRVMRATDPSTRQQTSATGAGFIRFEKDQDAVTAIAHINKNGTALGQKYGCPRPLEAKLADKTNQRKKQRAQQQQQPGLAAHHGLGPSPPGGQLPLSIFQQNPAALAAAARGAAAAAAAVMPGGYNAQMLQSGAAAQLYSPAAVQSSALTSYTSRVTPAAAPPSAPAHTSYVFQASPASAMTGGAGAGAPSLYQHQRNSWLIDPSSYAAAAGMYGPQLLAAPQTSLYATPDAAPLYYASAAAGLDPTATAYHPMGLTASAEPHPARFGSHCEQAYFVHADLRWAAAELDSAFYFPFCPLCF